MKKRKNKKHRCSFLFGEIRCSAYILGNSKAITMRKCKNTMDTCRHTLALKCFKRIKNTALRFSVGAQLDSVFPCCGLVCYLLRERLHRRLTPRLESAAFFLHSLRETRSASCASPCNALCSGDIRSSVAREIKQGHLEQEIILIWTKIKTAT